MTLHIDGDALVYLAGFAADSRNGPFSHSAYNIKLMINKALEMTREDEYKIFLTSTDPKVNFRTEILESYKKNRTKTCKKCGGQKLSKESYVDRIIHGESIMKRRFYTCEGLVKRMVGHEEAGFEAKYEDMICGNPVADTKPVYYNKIRKYMQEHYGAWVCPWGEADDWLAVGNPSFIATHDKDIYQVGDMGFYNLKSGEVLTIFGHTGELNMQQTVALDREGNPKVNKNGSPKLNKQLKGYGFKWFCAQMILGDKVDNIIKPYAGDGPQWVYKVFDPLVTMRESWNMVKLYYANTGNSDKLWIMAQLLWIARQKRQRCSEAVIEEYINEFE